jgi:hypothetical protein
VATGQLGWGDEVTNTHQQKQLESAFSSKAITLRAGQ